jgi:hypothetical protein
MNANDYLPSQSEIDEAFESKRNGDPKVPRGTLSSPADESAFLACLLCDPAGSGEALRKFPIRPSAFDDLRNRTWFTVLSQMIQTDQPLTAANVLEQFRNESDAGSFYQGLLNSDPFPLKAADFIPRLNDLHQRRVALAALKTAGDCVRDHSVPLESSIGDISSFLDNLSPQSPALREKLKSRRFDVARVVRPVQARYSIGNIPISTPGNLSAISAAVKSGKSSWIGAMIAATISGGGDPCLGIISSNQPAGAVIHVDTEQSVEDHDFLIRTVLRRADVAKPPPWLHSYCITGFTLKEAQDAIATLLSDCRSQHGSIHSLLIDGAADLVPDVNDPESCNSFIANLHAQSIHYDCSIIGVIHLNPSGEKTRGHLGSQLERKAESNLRLERDGDSLVCWSDKNRRAPILKNYGPRFEWSKDHEMHMLLDPKNTAKFQSELTMIQAESEAVFNQTKKSCLKWGDLLVAFMTELRLKESGARKRMEKAIKSDIIRKNLVGYYELTRL